MHPSIHLPSISSLTTEFCAHGNVLHPGLITCNRVLHPGLITCDRVLHPGLITCDYVLHKIPISSSTPFQKLKKKMSTHWNLFLGLKVGFLPLKRKNLIRPLILLFVQCFIVIFVMISHMHVLNKGYFWKVLHASHLALLWFLLICIFPYRHLKTQPLWKIPKGSGYYNATTNGSH